MFLKFIEDMNHCQCDVAIFSSIIDKNKNYDTIKLNSGEKNMNGEEFLNILYSDLALSDNVMKLTNNSNDKSSNIKKYLERLEKINKRATTQHKKDLLYELYYNKYIIKREDIPNYLLDEEKDSIIQSQKDSLSKWLNYLMDESTRYPMWAKYWVFQGMLKIGNHNEETNTYMKRTKKTISPFIEVNSAVIAKCISIMEKSLENKDNKSLSNFIENGSFQKLYCKYFQEFKNEQNQKSGFDGCWMKYNEGSEEDAIRLFESLQGFGCPWCTAGSIDSAKDQVMGIENYSGGDFYVYYTYNEQKEAVIPRLAIRMDGKVDIGEIRGVADSSQNVEEGLEEIIKRKLDEMPFLSEESKKTNYKAIEDTRYLTYLNQKYGKKEEFTLEEQKFLLEFYRKIEGFGWDRDPRILKLCSKIKIKDIDLAIHYLRTNIGKLSFYDNSKIISVIEPEIYNTIINNYELLQKISNSVNDILKICSPEISFSILEKNNSLSIPDTNIAFRNNQEYIIKFAKLVFEEIGFFSGLKYCSESMRNDKKVVLEFVKLDAFNIEYASPELKIDIDVINAAINSENPYPYIEEYYEKYLESEASKVRKNRK